MSALTNCWAWSMLGAAGNISPEEGLPRPPKFLSSPTIARASQSIRPPNLFHSPLPSCEGIAASDIVRNNSLHLLFQLGQMGVFWPTKREREWQASNLLPIHNPDPSQRTLKQKGDIFHWKTQERLHELQYTVYWLQKPIDLDTWHFGIYGLSKVYL